MNTLPALLALTLSVVSTQATAADTAAVSNSDATVETRRVEDTLLLHAGQAALAFGWEAKVEQPGKLLVICRDGDDGICIPLRIDKLTTASTDDGLFVEAAALAKALRFRIAEDSGRIQLEPAAPSDDDEDDLPAYNAEWGAGRGLRVGQTLPDIPLYDLQGREVRFSQFLGKQYIIYCWASW